MRAPFSNISELQKTKLFKLLRTHIYNFNKNEEILSTIKNENIVCILLDGHAQIVNIDYNGNEILIEELEKDSVFGSGISEINSSECQIRAIESCKVLVINYNRLVNIDYISHTYYNIFINNLLDIIHSKLNEKNERIRILTKKTIRDKLLEYFEYEYKKTRSKFIYLPNSFKDLADYFAINRSAMFRELKSLKEEKFIKIDGKKLTLLYTPQV